MEEETDWELISTTKETLQRAAIETDGLVANQAARALGLFTKAREGGCSRTESMAKVVIPYLGTVVFGPGKDFVNPPKPVENPNGSQQPLQLPTPAGSLGGAFSRPVYIFR